MKKVLRKLHRVLGLSVGLWAALAAGTGSVLVFSDEIDALLNPHLLEVAPRSTGFDLDGAVTAVRARFPDQPLQALRLPRAADQPVIVRVGVSQVTDVYLDPYSTQILGTRAEYGGVMGFLWDLHVHLLAGEVGETVAGVLGLFLLGMLVSGVVLWWPRRGQFAAGFRIRWDAAVLRRMFDLHRVAGVVAFPLLLIAVVTGAMLVFHQPTTAFLLATLGGPPRALPPQVEPPAGTGVQPVSRWIAGAEAAVPGAQPVSVHFPDRATAAATVRLRFGSNPHPNGRTFVAVDPHTGEAVHVHDWRKAGLGIRAADYKYPLHIGAAFGLPGRLLVLITGLAPVLLLATGGFMWWRKRRVRRESRNVADVSRRTTEGVSS